MAAAFARARSEGRIALAPYLVPGHPTPEETPAIIDALVQGGADMIEIGIPFSDPMADGSTIQRVAYEALANGMTPAGCIRFAAEARRRNPDTPLVFMTYMNPVLAYGIERFAADSAGAGVDGVILVDLPPEEAGSLKATFDAAGLALIFLAAPTSSDQRIQTICDNASGFIYCVSVAGVTGVRGDLPESLPDFLARVRRCTALPLAVGFGISRRAHIEKLTGIADAAAIGSALMTLVSESAPEDRPRAVREYMETLAGRRQAEPAG